MALNVLLVDPDEEWLETTTEYLKSQMYTVTAVLNGKDAQIALYNEKYFAVILNWDTENHSASQVLKFIKTNYVGQKVVLIVNNKDNLDYEEEEFEDRQKKFGATEVLFKPFEQEAIKGVLEGHQSLGDMVSTLTLREGVSDEQEVDENDDQFTSVKIDEFYSSKAVLFDVYVKLKSSKYVKILHAGDTFSKERIDKYKNEKNVEHLYFHQSDRRKYIQFHNHLAKGVIENKKAPAQVKVKIMQNVSEKFLEEAYTEGMKPQVLDQGKEVAENMYNLVEKQQDLYKLLRGYQDFDPNAFTHAFLTSMFSTSIIKQFEWQSKTTVEATALACLLHDIGKMKMPKEMLEKRPKDMNDEELELYQQHPIFGVELIESNRMINNSIKQIILQHHENFDGTGFPYNKRGSKILTLSNIVSLADTFVHIMIDEELKPTEALKRILTDKSIVVRFNSNIVENFIKVFVDPDKIAKEHVLPSNSRVVSKKVS